MRLDLFLKVSRLIARRPLAARFCDAGLISVNGLAAKSSRTINTGDEIEIRRRDRLTKVRVRHVPQSKQVSKHGAGELYEVILDEKTEEP